MSSALTEPALAVAGAVPQRQVDRGQRLRHVGGLAAGVEQLGALGAVARAEDRLVGLEGVLDGVERDAVVGLERRRLAPADDPVAPGEPQDEQLALGQLAPRERAAGGRRGCGRR